MSPHKYGIQSQNSPLKISENYLQYQKGNWWGKNGKMSITFVSIFVWPCTLQVDPEEGAACLDSRPSDAARWKGTREEESGNEEESGVTDTRLWTHFDWIIGGLAGIVVPSTDIDSGARIQRCSDCYCMDIHSDITRCLMLKLINTLDVHGGWILWMWMVNTLDVHGEQIKYFGVNTLDKLAILLAILFASTLQFKDNHVDKGVNFGL